MVFAFLLFFIGFAVIAIGLKYLKLAKVAKNHIKTALIWWGQHPIVLYIIYIVVMFGLSLM